MRTVLEALVKNSPLVITLIGLVLFLIGAAGKGDYLGLKVDIETGWRIALATVGGIVAILGSLLVWRDQGGRVSSTVSKAPTAKYGVKITSPKKGARFSDEFELAGTYEVKPPDKRCAVFAEWDGRYYFKRYIYFENSSSHTWSTKIRFGSTPGPRTIKIVELDEAGQALAEYQDKVAHRAASVGIEKLTPDIVICDSTIIEWTS